MSWRLFSRAPRISMYSVTCLPSFARIGGGSPRAGSCRRRPRRARHPASQVVRDQEAFALAVVPDRGLAPDGGEEMAVEVAARERVDDGITNPIDLVVAIAADVDRRRLVEEDRLDAIGDGHAGLHVQDDRDRNAVDFVGGQAG